MPDAVIVSTARTPLCKSWKGAFNMTHGATLGGHALRHAIERARLDPAEIEDVIMGCANPEGATGRNIARQIALRAGCPVTTSGMTVNRFCSSGLQTIAIAAQRVMTGEGDIFAAGGVESISCVQNEMNKHMINDDWILAQQARALLADAADRRVRREDLRHLARAAGSLRRAQPAARRRGARRRQVRRRDRAMQTTMKVVDKATGAESTKESRSSQDEGIRADTTYEGVAKIKPAIEGGVISAGNASQFSDGAGVCIVMNEKTAASKGLKPLGVFRGFAVAGCEPERDGHRSGVRGAEAAREGRPEGRATSICGSSTKRSRCR